MTHVQLIYDTTYVSIYYNSLTNPIDLLHNIMFYVSVFNSNLTHETPTRLRPH